MRGAGDRRIVPALPGTGRITALGDTAQSGVFLCKGWC